MPTTHTVYLKDSRFLDEVESNSVDLVVTAPPNPMEEIWDSVFIELNIEIQDAFEDEEPLKSYDLMHTELKKVWAELQRVMKPGGIVCIVSSDVFRQFNGEKRCFRNSGTITQNMVDCGFTPLPPIVWDASDENFNQYVGGGTVSPPTCYPKIQTHQIQIFRNGSEQADINRSYQEKSTFFYNEKKQWFNQVWNNLKHISLSTTEDNEDTLEISAADTSYPFELPYRLINMFSIYDDVVLDPFWGTGKTTLAAIASRRNSIGYELNKDLLNQFEEELRIVPSLSRKVVKERLRKQREAFSESEEQPKMKANNYDVPIALEDEKEIKFYLAENLKKQKHTEVVNYQVTHRGF